MRRDELEALREQKKHLIAEMRSVGALYNDGRVWKPEDQNRFDYCTREVEGINGQLQEQHKRELEEIRAGKAGSEFNTLSAGFERSFAREPLYEAFRSAGFARGKPAEILWNEFRSITWTGSVDNLSRRAAPR